MFCATIPTGVQPRVPGGGKSIMKKRIHKGFRPTNYFWAHDHGIRLASNIKGAERKAMYERLVREGDTEAADEILRQATLTTEQRRLSGSIHPAFMGGEFLPDCQTDEVEIARITIASTTQDVTSVYAKRVPEGIEYRVVDEYDGETLDGEPNARTDQPMTLSELLEFFLTAWDLRLVLAANFQCRVYPKHDVKGFVCASSIFYAEFGSAVQLWIDDWLKTVRRAKNFQE